MTTSRAHRYCKRLENRSCGARDLFFFDNQPDRSREKHLLVTKSQWLFEVCTKF